MKAKNEAYLKLVESKVKKKKRENREKYKTTKKEAKLTRDSEDDII